MKTKKAKLKKPAPVYMWAWATKDLRGKGWLLCKWAEPTRAYLILAGGRPAPEAKPVRVRCAPC